MGLTHEEFLKWFQQRLTLAFKLKLERFPQNPLWMAPDGSIPRAQESTYQHYQEIGELMRLVCLDPRVGRPPKIMDGTERPKPSKGGLDPILAHQAYRLSADGWHWTKIARELWPDIRPTDHKARNRIRSRVNRLVYRGRLLEEA
jgi:hypothetical protein